MVDSISSSSTSSLTTSSLGTKTPSASDMFSRLKNDLGLDSSTTSITKEQLNDYIDDLESSGDKSGKLGFLKQLSDNFDTVSGGSDSITVEDLSNNMSVLKPPSHGAETASSKKDPLTDLSSKVGASSEGITKDDLESYLSKLDSDSDEYKLINNLIDDFDSVSDDSGYITSSSMKSYFQSTSSATWQDPSTITSDQLKSPIDISV